MSSFQQEKEENTAVLRKVVGIKRKSVRPNHES